uniref:Replication protein A 70 kDa DNA-binding subunit B/D first OB fold domain-containing protein n=1 Tax=Daucus carota subsp. sativus TaxID=79200 RepID=A0A175YL33_DAUCS
MESCIHMLNNSTLDWTIRVRVTRVWPRISSFTDAVRGYNLILLDRHNHRIHAWVHNEVWQSLDGLIVEGGLYEITTFALSNCSAFLRPLSSTRLIRFLNVTTVQPYLDTSLSFPQHDVIGVVENPGQVSTIRTRHGDRRVHKFQVTDGHIFVRVTLLGSILDSSNTLFTANLQAPIVVVLAGVRVRKIPGDRSLDNYHLTASPWSQIFINMESDAARDMRDVSEVNAMFDHLEDLEKSRTDWKIKVRVTRLWPTSNAESGVVKGFNLILLDDDDDIMIPLHKFEILEVGDLIEPGGQSEVDENPEYALEELQIGALPSTRIYLNLNIEAVELFRKRFRLLVLADDNSFASTVLLTDRVVKRLEQTTVTNLMNSSKEAPISEMPSVLKNIVGKTVTVKISLSKSNVDGDSNIYRAVDLCEGSVSGKKAAEYSPITKFPSFDQSQTDDYVVCLETPTSSDSVSKKIKMVTYFCTILMHMNA